MYSNNWNILAITIGLVCLISSTYAQERPLNCNAANALSLEESAAFIGSWYEIARNPATPTVGCVKIDSALSDDNTTLSVNVTFSDTPNNWWQNQTVSANVTFQGNTAEGNVTFISQNQTQTPAFFKLLQTFNVDGVKYVAGCGLTNSSDDSTVYAYLLSNSLNFNRTVLNYINNLAAENFSDFSNSSNIATVNQQGCFYNSASTSVPVLTVLFAAFYVLMKALHLA